MDEGTPPVVDGITAATPDGDEKGKPEPKAEPAKDTKKKGTDGKKKDPPNEKKQMVSRVKFVLITFVGLPYMIYIIWCLFLLSVLPDATGRWEFIIPYGKLSAMLFAGFLVMATLFMLMRVGKASGADDRVRYMSFVRIGLFLLPGLALSGLMPYSIGQEPPLRLRLVQPLQGTELVAPLSMTFSSEEAVAILKRRGHTVLSFQWDFTGDGVFDEETIVPAVSAYYDRQGAYNLSAILNLDDGTTRRLSYRVAIPNAVFSYTPVIPTVDEPIKFSVAHLVTQDAEVQVREVTWDFDNDGIPEETTTELETTHTFLRTGSHTVTVTIVYTNQSQNYFFRTLEINKPAPLPFPVSISTTPEFLESPAPFQVVFRINTDEPLTDVKWDFDDGSPEEVGSRVGHTFRERRVFQVTARARNEVGEISKVTKIIRVVEELRISDLKFEGTHKVEGGEIFAEAPVAIELTPKTIMPLVDFWWEAPGASQVSSTDTTLKAIFREEGLYTVVMLAKDAEGRVKRLPIELSVNPKSQNVTFDMKPTQGVAPLNVQFDASDSFIPGDPINGFIWEFDSGAQQVEQRFGGARVDNEYQLPGEYTVRLTVSTESGRTESTSRKIVVRAPFLKSCFTVSRTEGPAPLGVRFDRSCSTGAASKVTWDFGDGSQSPLKDNIVVHTFGEPGDPPKDYTVKLLLEDVNGTVDTVQQVIRTY